MLLWIPSAPSPSLSVPNLSRDEILRRERSDKSIPVQEFGDAESNDPTGCVFSTDRKGARERVRKFPREPMVLRVGKRVKATPLLCAGLSLFLSLSLFLWTLLLNSLCGHATIANADAG